MPAVRIRETEARGWYPWALSGYGDAWASDCKCVFPALRKLLVKQVGWEDLFPLPWGAPGETGAGDDFPQGGLWLGDWQGSDTGWAFVWL